MSSRQVRRKAPAYDRVALFAGGSGEMPLWKHCWRLLVQTCCPLQHNSGCLHTGTLAPQPGGDPDGGTAHSVHCQRILRHAAGAPAAANRAWLVSSTCCFTCPVLHAHCSPLAPGLVDLQLAHYKLETKQQASDIFIGVQLQAQLGGGPGGYCGGAPCVCDCLEPGRSPTFCVQVCFLLAGARTWWLRRMSGTGL